MFIDINDADNNPSNELITSVTLNGSLLEITEAGVLKTIDLAISVADTDKDSRISQAEAMNFARTLYMLYSFKTTPPISEAELMQKVANGFSKADLNRDGYLTEAEKTTAMESVQ